MKHFFAILPLMLLPSCILLEDSTVTKPSKKNLTGFYKVSQISPLTSHKKEIGAISINLKSDGGFRMCDSERALVRSPGLNSAGYWKIVPTYGLDLGSRQCWGVQLVTKDDLVITAHCLGNNPTDGLLISGEYIRDSQRDCYFVMKKSEQE